MPRTGTPAQATKKRGAASALRKPTHARQPERKRARLTVSEQIAIMQRAAVALDRIEREQAADEKALAELLPRPRRKRTSRANKDLITAAYYGDLKSANAALAAGASPDARDADNGHTALYMAVAGDRLAMVELLLDRGADPNATVIANLFGVQVCEITPLTRAVDERKRKIAKALARRGGRIVRNKVQRPAY